MSYKIACLPGDGIGPEVATSVKRILDAIGHQFEQQFEVSHHLIGGAAIDEFGVALPDETLSACKQADATFLAAIGGPKWDHSEIRPEQGLLKLRAELEVYANIRPLTMYPQLASASPLKSEILEGTDFIIVRELTGGIYFGAKSRHSDYATDECKYSVEEVERIARVAFELATERNNHLTSVDKANVLETSKLWREVVSRIGEQEFPQVALHHQLVDSCAMKLIQSPSEFDVILTENMFGDILSDEASVLAGSMGLLASSSVGSRYGLFEPIHGSAPDIAGQGIANPYASILSIAMMLRWLKLPKEAESIELAVSGAIDSGILTKDLNSSSDVTTQQAIEAVVSRINAS
ncbi:MAG: 3-isopropylmalate dehydrogenase [Kangiellaceae bacterium]|nr:3-isopropylmalate dehydrogenase [Kangiellaceae bacterium]